MVNGKGGKQRTSILHKPVLDALNAHLQGETPDISSMPEIRDMSLSAQSG